MSTELTTYPERALAMTKAARKAACERAGEKYHKAMHAAGNIGELEVVVINRLREAGLELITACGREQLLFSLEGKEFCRRELLPFLPEMDLAKVQVCVHIANTVKTPLANQEELRAVRPELQLAFQMFGLADAPRRKELQTAHARNLFSDFVSRATSLKLLFDELEQEEPMAQWPPDKLDEFLETAQPVKEKIERAEKLRLGIKN